VPIAEKIQTSLTEANVLRRYQNADRADQGCTQYHNEPPDCRNDRKCFDRR
jgi:hypothetical protein